VQPPGAASSKSSSDDEASNVNVESECSESDPPLQCQFPLQCRPFQCLHYLGDATLPLHERQHIFGSKHSLQRHFDRHHQFQPGQSCPFPNVTVGSSRSKASCILKSHAAGVHGIYMSEKCQSSHLLIQRIDLPGQ